MAKVINNIPEHLLKQLPQLGYRPVKAEDQRVFDPYYDQMNGHWSSATCFLCLVAYEGIITAFYKKAGEVLLCLEYDAIEDELVAIPFIGRYTRETVSHAFRILQSDMAALGVPLVVMGIAPWMLPFYQESGVSWEITDSRDLQEYIYQRPDFLASMESSDSRYRYRYFIRRYAPETVTLTKEHWRECVDCMEEFWCPYTNCSSCHYGCPRGIVARVMREFEYMETDGLLVCVGGRPVGFCITTYRNGLGVYQYKHADNHMKGINEYLLRECFTRFPSGAEEINYTEDIGDEGLRAYKSELAPYTLLSRFTLSGIARDAPITTKELCKNIVTRHGICDKMTEVTTIEGMKGLWRNESRQCFRYSMNIRDGFSLPAKPCPMGGEAFKKSVKSAARL